jgi:hypothetical protein
MERVPTKVLYALGRDWAWFEGVADWWVRSFASLRRTTRETDRSSLKGYRMEILHLLGVAALDAAALRCPVDESLQLIAMPPAELEEFSGVEIGRFLTQKGFETPLNVGAAPGCEAIAARGNPVVAERPEHLKLPSGFG